MWSGPKHWLVPGSPIHPGPTVLTRPRTAATADRQDGAGHEMASRPDHPGRPASLAEQVQQVFHELHAAGRNALCAVCDSQYGTPARSAGLSLMTA